MTSRVSSSGRLLRPLCLEAEIMVPTQIKTRGSENTLIGCSAVPERYLYKVQRGRTPAQSSREDRQERKCYRRYFQPTNKETKI
jgi:hypothetical protein